MLMGGCCGRLAPCRRRQLPDSCGQHLASATQHWPSATQTLPLRKLAPVSLHAPACCRYDHWFPIAFVRDIPDGAPYGFQLLGEPM